MPIKDDYRKEIRELKRMIAALKISHRAMLRKELAPLRKRLAKLDPQVGRKRRLLRRTIAEIMDPVSPR